MKTETDLKNEIKEELFDQMNENKLSQAFYDNAAESVIRMVKENKEVLFPVIEKAPLIKSSASAYDILKKNIADLEHEEFWIIPLDRSHRPKDVIKVSQGGLTGTVIDVRMILKHCIDNKATALIVSHNHPSGNSKPSEADLNITRKIKNACDLMDISLLDHLIITKDGYRSFADDGLLI